MSRGLRACYHTHGCSYWPDSKEEWILSEQLSDLPDQLRVEPRRGEERGAGVFGAVVALAV